MPIIERIRASIGIHNRLPLDVLPLQAPYLRTILRTLLAFLSIAIVLPLVFLVVWAFWGSETVGLLSKDASFYWFQRVLFSPEWRESIFYSLVLAITTSGMGCGILASHFFFLRYTARWVEYTTFLITIIPAILPAVIFALALRIFGATVGFSEQCLLGIGHIVLVLPVQYFVFEAFQERIPTEMLHAASTLGANPFRNLIFVYVPLVLSAIRSAFLVGFFFSFDEIIIASFIIDSPLITVPKRLWDEVNRSMDPSPAVIATMLLLMSFSIITTFIFGWIWASSKHSLLEES